ncbi:DegT/DnrJ/EryC1/StrS family aminotransferase [Nitratifractor sp.]
MDHCKEFVDRAVEGEVEGLERRFCERIGLPHAAATSRSSNALHLAMCTLDLKRGDKVICSVNSYVDVPEAVRHFDAEPIFVDCERERYTIDPERVEDVLRGNKSKKLRAIIVSHIAGKTADMEALWDLAEKYNVHVIEDVSDALTARYGEKAAGTDERTLLSVYAIGDKCDRRFHVGMLGMHDETLLHRAHAKRYHGMVHHKGEVEYLYDVVDIGCAYELNEMEALIANHYLATLEDDTRRRQEIAAMYREQLQGLEHVRLPAETEGESHYRFIVEIDRNRDSFARAMRDRGVETGLHYVPLHTTRYYKEKYGFRLFDFPVAMEVYQKVLSLPNRPDMSDEEVAYVCDVIREVDRQHI